MRGIGGHGWGFMHNPVVSRVFAALALSALSTAQAVTLTHPRVEYTDTPMTDVAQPRFSWFVEEAPNDTVQIAWRLRVSTDSHRPGNVWDSGRVVSPNPYGHEYAGPVLKPATRYYWDATVETSAGTATVASYFDTGLDDWGVSRWIGKGDGGSTAAPLLRKSFRVDGGLRHAALYVAAGGYADVSIDGVPASDAVLSPGFTDYGKRVQYTATDVTQRLHAGENVMAMELGRGFYGMTNPNVWHWERAPWHGEPRVRAVLRLTYTDGHTQDVVTDRSWRLADGPTLLDDLYGGETYDARKAQVGYDAVGFDDAAWRDAVEVDAPKGKLVAQSQPPIRVLDTLRAIAVTEPKPGTYVFAFPRVIAGWATFAAQAPAGTTLTAVYGEKLLPDGTVDARDEHHYFGNGFQTDRFTLAGRGIERWHPRFSYKGFRYVQVDGWPKGRPSTDAVTAQVVHTDVERTGHFESSNELLNWIHTAAVDTMLNNLHGIPTDTPMYEKNGWTGDGMLGADMFLRNFDAGALLAKWVQDIEDTRSADGAPLLIAPNPGWGKVRAPTWHAAYVLVPWSLYMYRGDRRVLADHVEGMAKYVRMEDARSPGGIADTELGDWVSPETDPGGENAPEDKRVAATAYLYRMARAMGDIERALGDKAAATAFDGMAARVRTAFNSTFYDKVAGRYRGTGDKGYRQAHQLLALAFGLAPDDQRERIANGLVADVKARDNHLDTGALATKIILPVLTATGHADVAWSVATQTTFPSWGFWKANGATSLWEHWKLASRSRGHYFLGTIDDWLYEDVAGLRPLSPGWERIEVRPALVAWLDRAEAKTRTPYGDVAVAWQREPGGLTVDLRVPVGATALVRLPAGQGSPWRVNGTTLVPERCDADFCARMGSGVHRIVSSL
ncbi:alpha-L-rhamnosidase [Luteibacter rhizovicinus]|uniref:alpha-L-rhamnosidase n=1 Tax=Luteibacter rhizovicinus TaxID=242606 RepID=A0A4R3YIX1_9GAMM|nr:alpha-L-rhamnosidase [Luteibacter rhizovicinus]TCV92357.1 alpha-L-rhamnosidase [Luteibacter rhizovicinus]